MGKLIFSTLNCTAFSFFLFSFLRVPKKHKNANKRISYYFPLRCFLSAFLIFVWLFAFCAFAWLRFCAFCAFLCFLILLVLFYAFGAFWWFLVRFVLVKSFCKKNKTKAFKTALITSFILLLKFISSQSSSIITTFMKISQRTNSII